MGRNDPTSAVQATRTIENKWLVKAGLFEGERVIVEGLQKVRPGMQVTVTGPATGQSGQAGEQAEDPVAADGSGSQE